MTWHVLRLSLGVHLEISWGAFRSMKRTVSLNDVALLQLLWVHKEMGWGAIRGPSLILLCHVARYC